MATFNSIVELDPDPGLFVGSILGWPRAQSGRTLDELVKILREAIERLFFEDGDAKSESGFAGVQTIQMV